MAKAERDIRINFTGNTQSFQNATKRIMGEVGSLQKRLTGLSATFKSAFAIGVGMELKEFLKGTFRDAIKDGSELNRLLGTDGVNAAQALQRAFGDVKLSIQQATIGVLKEFTPALQAAANASKSIAERISGGPTGTLARVNAESRANAVNVLDPRGALETLEQRRTSLIHERATVFEGRGMFDFRTKWEKSNQAELLDAKISQLTMEIDAIQANFKALSDQRAKMAFQAISQHGNRLAGILQQTASGLMGQGQGLAGNLLGRAQAGIIGFRTSAVESQRQRAQQIIEANKTEAERGREELQELNRLKYSGALSPEQYGRATSALSQRLQGMLPSQQQRSFGPTPALAATEGRFITMGRMQDLPQKQLDAIEHGNKELHAIRQLLSEINRKDNGGIDASL